ncbi:septum formation initiator family protein [Paenibacillaceae bacterium]|nr:septum formation initiator family protein [Paenibacillaceae bacterium]
MKTAPAQKTVYPGAKRRLKLWFIIVALFMGWALYTMFNQAERRAETEQRLAAAKEQQELRVGESDELKKKLELLNDPEYIQELARKDYGMIMPGETPIQITRPND